jgi:hypothetical protein
MLIDILINIIAFFNRNIEFFHFNLQYGNTVFYANSSTLNRLVQIGILKLAKKIYTNTESEGVRGFKSDYFRKTPFFKIHSLTKNKNKFL